MGQHPSRESKRKGTHGAQIAARLCIAALCFGLAGCDFRGAPSYSIFGAFFPAWLLCTALGLFGALIFRGLAIATGLEDAMPLRLVVYTAFAAGLAVWSWLGLFGDR